MTARTTERLASDIANTGAEAVAGQVHTLGAGFFGELAAYARSSEYRSRLETAGFVDAAPLVDTLRIVAHRMETRSHDSDLSDDDQAVAENIARRAETLGGQIEEAVALADENKAYWIEVSEKGNARLKAGFIEVAPLLSRTLFARCRSIALVSATLATAKSFGFVRRELGVPGMPLELVAPTPFDFARQSLLVVPTGLPEPRNAAYLDAVVHHVQAVVDLCGGRTLGLFTSYRALDYVHARLDCSGRTLLRQGDAPRHVLIRRFRDDVTSVLLGTASFWTGVDVPGESLTALVIDKLPFPRPDEPLIDAICARDPRAFDNYLLPRTIMTLRQGLGRLIRTETDIGVAVVLDRRILGDTYARRIRQSLPPMRRTRDLAEIAAFLKPLPASGPRDRAE
jgi:ATP-dependent DNA helicase DinG